ncbi:MAG: hypothetical protein AB3X41_09305 [Leptothrix ochracea]|uniref:hypothetical protein n=1 Tax=Leptothrix ochracea TaxID=735331 RepID=UPI0034E27106
MNLLRFIALSCLALALAAGCGGGSSSNAHATYQQAAAAANAKEAEARGWASPTPCTTAAQCDALFFVPPSGVCSCPSYLAYSLAAPSASAASAAATAQQTLAQQARVLGGLVNTCACTTALPTLTCTASTCALAP